MSGKVKVWGNVVTVEWADPIEDPDPEVMAKVSAADTHLGTKFPLATAPSLMSACVHLAGEGAVCEKPGQRCHRGDPGEVLQPVWEAGAGQETQRLCLYPL